MADFYDKIDDLYKQIKALESEVMALENAGPTLLPCPFCGSPAKLEHSGEYTVSCTAVGTCYGHNTWIPNVHGFTFEKDAVRLWNKRASTKP